jgi:hypothetical protein
MIEGDARGGSHESDRPYDRHRWDGQGRPRNPRSEKDQRQIPEEQKLEPNPRAPDFLQAGIFLWKQVRSIL